ncbi:MAG TPA: HlyD family efflux transporter periplasmic adaptor subunit [Burkholderiaceae bacterium]
MHARPLIASLAGAALASTALAWAFWPRPVEVELTSATRGPMRVEVVDDARTRVREIYQVSSPVNGQVLRVEVHAGDRVEGGRTKVADVLPIAPSFLDARTRAQLQSLVKSAEAGEHLAASEVARAKAELDFARADLERSRALADKGIIPRASLERAQMLYDTAAAQRDTTQAALKAKRYDLEAARSLLLGPEQSGGKPVRASIALVAPVSGEVLRVLRESESVTLAGVSIMEIGDPHGLEIVADLVSEDAVKVREGDPAVIADWGGPQPLHARVRRIEPSGFTKISALGVEEQRVNVLLDFTDPPERWSSIADGYRVMVHVIVWRADDVVRIPVSAMFRRGDGWAAFRVQNGRARLAALRVGHVNDEVAEVLDGLSAGDQVIAHPSDRIADGIRVIPRTTR